MRGDWSVLAAVLGALQRVQAVVGVHVEHIAPIGGGGLECRRPLGIVAVCPPELGGVITKPGTGREGLVDVVGEECAGCPGCTV